MQEPSLVLSFVDRAALEREHAQHLAHGRAFVSGKPEHPLFTRCVLRLIHPDTAETLEIPCEVVMLMEQGPAIGTAVQFIDRSCAALAAIGLFVGQAAEDESDAAEPLAWEEEAGDDGDFRDLADDGAGEPTPRKGSSPEYQAPARGARLRGLSAQQRLQIAKGPALEDRVQLERLYGSAVWEALLRNPAITIPEVARMGRKGNLPRPLLDLIVENERWIRNPLVRRALLTNPRLSAESCQRVLRLLPPRELKLVPHQTAYPQTVRQVAQRLLSRG